MTNCCFASDPNTSLIKMRQLGEAHSDGQLCPNLPTVLNLMLQLILAVTRLKISLAIEKRV
jgi:hypothetical protein